ncbi:winged helix-turn-helix transcriptional regulator [Paenibacillus xerothermodurans]|uniref:DNA-binding response regulator n=1 Tax=Paenibacillus xerothermodurans TaxID=1977292 RepID=A0A2W1NRG2_PAEXE|nr:response regulator transcription factor [Paenibacillus xerothermodurans]PZE22115.1 DNA-binding response regulator [Paenibacillus xerothermodurans]
MQRENAMNGLRGSRVTPFRPIAPANDQAAGMYCASTNRIVVISPYPYSLRELVGQLTAKCYDVMVFHYLDEEALAKLDVDLIIIDLTQESLVTPGATNRPLLNHTPVLRLVNSRDEQSPAPFSPLMHHADWSWTEDGVDEVLERIRSLLLHSSRPAEQRADQVYLKDMLVDYKRVSVYVGDSRIEVTKTEFDLLKALLDAGGSVLSRQELMDRVWGEHYFGGSNTVDVHVKSLRHKLKDNPKVPKYIETIRGVGYRIAD